ncbi:hypothetical protein ACFQZW_11560 [Lutibacter aestuarii]|uniref:NlpE N-terminal domain-containing protein n=1 Tax=Lutibacter aestuarii TaxID=861111 RepID=A0ABW2ZC39_9FLAO
MKKMIQILIILFGLVSTKSVSQNVGTNYIRGENSTYCGEKEYYFTFLSKAFIKTDNESGEKSYGPSKITQTDYDNNGYYFEIRTPNFLLDEEGISEYRKYYHYSHKILYDRRGGEILYVYELNMDSNINVGKFYFTLDGYKIFCN